MSVFYKIRLLEYGIPDTVQYAQNDGSNEVHYASPYELNQSHAHGESPCLNRLCEDIKCDLGKILQSSCDVRIDFKNL